MSYLVHSVEHTGFYGWRIKVLKSRKIEQPVYIRLSGTNEEIAREMLKDGITPAVVSKYTGLTMEEIESLTDA